MYFGAPQLACTPMLFYFSFPSFLKHQRTRERSERARTTAEGEKEKKVSSSPTSTPLRWRSINPLLFIFYHLRLTDFEVCEQATTQCASQTGSILQTQTHCIT